jgi:hypothetical protein
MEQAATRVLVRDQVESPLENGSLIVPAILLFPPEQLELIRQHLNPNTCLYCSSRRERSKPKAHVSRSSISAVCLSRLQEPRFKGRDLGIETATQDPPASSPCRNSTSSAISTTASPLRDPSQQSHRPSIATLLSTDASPSNAP